MARLIVGISGIITTTTDNIKHKVKLTPGLATYPNLHQLFVLYIITKTSSIFVKLHFYSLNQAETTSM